MRLKLNREHVGQVVLVLSCAALIAAWVSEYVFGLQACSLCLYQRYLYIAAIVILAVYLFILKNHYQKSPLMLTSLVLLLCAGTAGYQVAVENQWVDLPKVCQAAVAAGSFEDFKAKLTTKPHISCDAIQWSLFGISMAGYNFLFALGLSLFSLMGVLVNDKTKKKFARR
jgi:disulfide bond formation protein DsbB